MKYCFESAVAITLRFQLFSARYTALQMKNSVRIISAINRLYNQLGGWAGGQVGGWAGGWVGRQAVGQ